MSDVLTVCKLLLSWIWPSYDGSASDSTGNRSAYIVFNLPIVIDFCI